ncbi:MAG: ATP-binding cassette domain-containing protein [Mesorhizobium sp.]
MTDGGLQLDQVTIALGGKTLLTVSACVAAGEVLTVMGQSGAGKSSLLAYIGGFLDPAFRASGKVFAGGVELTALPPEDRHAGILFQDPLLFPHLSVAGNLAFAIPPRIAGRAARRAHADAALQRVGLEGLGDRDPDTLSGGQKARVALARVMLSEPRALLLDEPFAKLDRALKEQMRALVFSQARRASLPLLLVTHDEADAAAAGGAIVSIGD